VSENPDEFLDLIVAELRRPAPLSPDLDDRIMAAVRGATPKAPPRRLHWLVRPTAVMVTPVRILALAAGLGGLLVAGAALLSTGSSPIGGARSSTVALRPVQFVLLAPGATAVTVVGDFNDWNSAATPLQPIREGGLWTVTIPLPAGRHQYAFVVDGREWRPDPQAPEAPDDDFGARNSVVTVGSRSS
jgi:hypothetical protein